MPWRGGHDPAGGRPVLGSRMARCSFSDVKAICQHSVETPSLARHWMEDAKGLQ
jgi:hypothetical protein